MRVTLYKNGLIKKVPGGYSWTSLLFGCFVPLCRGDVKGFIIQFALAMLTFGASWLVVPFTYNKKYKERLLEEGWSYEK